MDTRQNTPPPPSFYKRCCQALGRVMAYLASTLLASCYMLLFWKPFTKLNNAAYYWAGSYAAEGQANRKEAQLPRAVKLSESKTQAALDARKVLIERYRFLAGRHLHRRSMDPFGMMSAEQRQAWALKFFYRTVHQEARDELNALERASKKCDDASQAAQDKVTALQAQVQALRTSSLQLAQDARKCLQVTEPLPRPAPDQQGGQGGKSSNM